MSNIQSAISAINAKFDLAFNTKNAADIGQLYAENAVVLPAPAGATVNGRQAVVDFFTGLIVMVDAQGARQTFGGNVHLVYSKQADGQWLAVNHIWN